MDSPTERRRPADDFFLEAFKRLNEPTPSSIRESGPEVMARTSYVQLEMARGLAQTINEAEERLSKSVGTLTTQLKAAADQADRAATSLANYTKWLMFATFALVAATLALVAVEVMASH